MFDNNRRDITVAMMKNYPLLLRKFMADKAKVPYLVEIIVHMNLELYSLKRQEQVGFRKCFVHIVKVILLMLSSCFKFSYQSFKNALQLIREAFFKHGEKDSLRSCMKAFSFCAIESRGELQDFVQNQLKEVTDELISKLKSAMKEIEVYSMQ